MLKNVRQYLNQTGNAEVQTKLRGKLLSALNELEYAKDKAEQHKMLEAMVGQPLMLLLVAVLLQW
jgi:hypothetical protein